MLLQRILHYHRIFAGLYSTSIPDVLPNKTPSFSENRTRDVCLGIRYVNF